MKSITKLVAIATVLVIAAGVFAQGGGGRGQGRGFGFGGGGVIGLLRRDDVKTDLKLTDDQKTKITDLQTKMRQDMQAARDNASASGDFSAVRDAMQKLNDQYKPQFMAVLTPDQQTRLKQINIQMMKARALTDTDVQTDLGLSADQKSKISDLVQKANDANRELFQKVRNGELDRDQADATRQKNDATLQDELLKVLTPDQADKFKSMAGPTFTPTDQPRGGGPGGRGGGGGGGGR